MNLLLASTSTYRATQLAQLGLTFQTARPICDETPKPNETACKLAPRLAINKAKSLAQHWPQHWIIGADQCADLQGQIVGKPGDHHAAHAQLSKQSGQNMRFVTAIALYHPSENRLLQATHNTDVRFRQLCADEIERYLKVDKPYDCAGSFKVEGLGISLFEHIHSDDPSGLIGLPLIALSQLLRQAGAVVP